MDRFGRRHTYLRVSLTDRCGFRCLYCMPDAKVAWKPKDALMTDGEILRACGVFTRLGVRKIRLTGGEPTVRPGWLELAAALCELDPAAEVHLTTNGSVLRGAADALAAAGVRGVNVSVDSVRPERFRQITQRGELQVVLDGIDAALAAGLDVKINTVVLPGLNCDEIGDIVDHFAEMPVQVRFIEFMPFAGNAWAAGRVVGYAEMRAEAAKRFEIEPLPGAHGAVAKEFALVGRRATIGFITSMTESFCGECSRVRLTADGGVKPCLFLPATHNLRDRMRAGAPDDDIAQAIHDALDAKWEGHPPMERWLQRETLHMVQIGG